jgi:RNA polymerase sigma factor (sigma-70 family)
VDPDSEFSEFVAGSMRRLRRQAFVWTRDWDRADDAVQSALERVYKAWGRIGPRDPYLYTVKTLHRLLISEARRPSSTEVAMARFHGHLEPHVTDHVEEASLLAAIRDMKPRYRTVLILRYVDDLSVSETARVLSCSQGQVKRLSFDARKELAAVLKDDYAEGLR